ncbi:uncharacterized protein Dvir_GJ27090, partial [Drosophila virilis]
MTTSTITSVSETRESVDIHIKEEVKLPEDPLKSVEKLISPTDVAKTVSKGYSDDESDDDFGIVKPLDKPIPPTTPLLPFAVKTFQKTDDIVKPLTELKDDKPQAKLDEKPKSPIDVSKLTFKEYSDDESDEEICLDKPQEKLPSTTPLVPLAMTTSTITSVSETRESVDIHIKEEVKLPEDPLQSVEKPISPTDVAKTVSKGYSDDESDDNFGIVKRLDKPFPLTTPLLPLADKTLQKTDDIVKPLTDLEDDKPQAKLDEKPKSPIDASKQTLKETDDIVKQLIDLKDYKPQTKLVEKPKSPIDASKQTLKETDDIVKPLTELKDDKPQAKLDEKPKSPIDASKQTLKEYSDNESDEDIGFDKPKEKLLSQAIPLVPVAMTTSTITSVSETRESVDIHIKEEVKLPEDPLKSVEKPISPTDVAKTVSKGYSDDESDDDFGIVKPLDKPIPSTTPLLPLPDKTLQKTDDIVKPLTELKDDKPQAKLDEKPKSPIDASKQTLKETDDIVKPLTELKDDKPQAKLDEKPKSPIDVSKLPFKEYSDDESDEEICLDKPQEKLPSTTPLVPLAMTTSKITAVSHTRESVDIHIKEEVKLPEDPLKSVEKPISPTDVAKTVSKGYSDDESDDDFGIVKPLDKPIPSTTPLLPLADKTLQKTDDIVKPLTELKDDKPQAKLDEKPKSPIDASKQTLKETDDIVKPLTELKDDKPQAKLDEKPKSPSDASKQTLKEYSDDESDEDIGFDKPKEKPLSQAIPLVPVAMTTSTITSVSETRESVDIHIKEEVKLPEDPLQSVEKPISPTDVAKTVSKGYSDDESDDDFGIVKPLDKPIPSTTPLLPLEDKSLQKTDDIVKPLTELKDDKPQAKLDEKPKSPIDASKRTLKEYSDNESDEDIGVDKPKEKPLSPAIPLVPVALTTSTISSDYKPQAKLDEKPKSPIDASKQTLKEYSDNESDEDIGFDKPKEKPLSPAIPLVPVAMTTSTITSVSETRESVDIHIKEEVKLPKDPLKSVEKPKSPTDVAKTVSKGYSDDESDDDFGIVKPLDKPIPSTTPLLPLADKTLQKTDYIVKPLTELKDDKPQAKLDEKPKSPIDVSKLTFKEYSDDESDEEISLDKPQEKLPSTTPLVPLAMTTSKITA